MAQKTMDEKSMKSLTDTLYKKNETYCRFPHYIVHSYDVHKFVFKLMILSPSARFTMYAA